MSQTANLSKKKLVLVNNVSILPIVNKPIYNLRKTIISIFNKNLILSGDDFWF
jgi:hypothetical protein